MNKKITKNSHDETIMGKEWWQRFGKGVMPTLSKLSKAFLLPIALLPIAGVFLGIGATISANTSLYSAGWYIGSVMNQMGNVAFSNLPILFAISVALAYTKDSGIAAITAVVGFLVFNGIQAALLRPITELNEVIGKTVTDENGLVHPLYKEEIVRYTMLWWTNISPQLVTSNIGITSLNTGVFAAIFVGALSAKMYNRFYQTQLPKLISFFSGTKLVPIVTFGAVIPLSFIFMFTWPGIGVGLSWFGTNTGKLLPGVDSLIYEVIERSLIPFGLHHVFYAPLWWTSAGGSMGDAITNALNDPNFVSHQFTTHQETVEAIQRWISTGGIEWDKYYQSVGDQTMMYQVIAHGNEWLNFKDLELLGFNLGRFQSGKFAFMMFGLPMAAAAMLLNVPKENRKQVMGIYFSAAFTSFLTGITEPIEYTFLFVAPWLFYGIHMPLAALSFFLTSFMGTHVSMTVSGGFIDYIVFGLIPYNLQTNPLHILWIGGLMAGLYFGSFYFTIKLFNRAKLKKSQPLLDIPGMKTTIEAKLYTKADYKEKKGSVGETNPANQADWFNNVLNSHDDKLIKAANIINYLGGPENITDVDACASRLRVTVIDNSLVDLEAIKSLGGTTGGLIKGQNIQIVYGGEQEAIKPRMNEILQTIKTSN